MRGDRPDVLVVGGGIAGAASALELASRGAGVTVLDRDRPGSATGAAAGMLAPQYEGEAGDPLFRLGVESRDGYAAFVERIAALSGRDPGYRTDGMLVANRTDGETEDARRSLRAQRDQGLRGEILAPDRAREIHSGASPRPHSYLWLPDEGQVDAQRLAAALPEALRAAGVDLRPGTPARAVESSGSGGERVGVLLEGGDRLEAGAVIVAAGAWTSRLRGLPGAPEIRPVKGQMVRMAPPSPLPPVILADHAGHYLVPRDDGTAVIGSTMEDAGFAAEPTDEVVSDLMAEAARLCPPLADAQGREAWAGLRPIAPDGRPVIGPDPSRSGVFFATGYGRHGILLAPLAGRAVAELALEGSTEVDWRPFRPDRPALSGGA